MAKRKKLRKRNQKVAKSGPMSTSGSMSTGAQLVRVFATWVIKDMKPEEAAIRLLGMGFDANEISDMLLVNKNYANNAKARWKKAMKKKVRQQDPE